MTRMACEEIPRSDEKEIGGESYVHFMKFEYPHDEYGDILKNIIEKSNKQISKETKCRHAKLEVDME